MWSSWRRCSYKSSSLEAEVKENKPGAWLSSPFYLPAHTVARLCPGNSDTERLATADFHPRLTCWGTRRLPKPSQTPRPLMSLYQNRVGSLFKLEMQIRMRRCWQQRIHLSAPSVSKGSVSFYLLVLLLPLNDDINSKMYYKGKKNPWSDGLNLALRSILTYLSPSGNAAS